MLRLDKVNPLQSSAQQLQYRQDVAFKVERKVFSLSKSLVDLNLTSGKSFEFHVIEAVKEYHDTDTLTWLLVGEVTFEAISHVVFESLSLL